MCIRDRVKNLMLEIGTKDQILFWNADQLQLMNSPGRRFVVFCSPYGTGKSILMSTKCEMEATNNCDEKNGKKCLYVYGGQEVSRKHTLLHLQQISKWQGKEFYQNIDVLDYWDIAVSTTVPLLLPVTTNDCE